MEYAEAVSSPTGLKQSHLSHNSNPPIPLCYSLSEVTTPKYPLRSLREIKSPNPPITNSHLYLILRWGIIRAVLPHKGKATDYPRGEVVSSRSRRRVWVASEVKPEKLTVERRTEEALPSCSFASFGVIVLWFSQAPTSDASEEVL